MTNRDLSQDYWKRIPSRMKAVKLLFQENNYADVIREGQELTELLFKAWLRSIGVEPPKWHDVGPVIEMQKTHLPPLIQKELAEILSFSKYLRKERENSFYGDDDLIPLESYTETEARSTIAKLEWLIELFRSEFEK